MSISGGNRPSTRCRLLLAAVAALGCVMPAAAQNKPAAQKPAPAMEQEVIVTGRHDGEPDFQEQQEFHAEEYRKLKQIYDPDPLPIIRSDRLTRMPEAISSTVQGKPTLTEKQW